jgi:hypothetical protein
MSDVRGRVPTASLRLDQRADELDERLLHIDAEVLPHAFGRSFKLGQCSPQEGCPFSASQSIKYAGHEHIFQHILAHVIYCSQALHHVGEADIGN